MNFCEDAPALACQNFYAEWSRVIQAAALVVAFTALAVLVALAILKRVQ